MYYRMFMNNLLRAIRCITVLTMLCVFTTGYCQKIDTIRKLDQVIVQGYLSRQPLVQTPSSVAILDSKDLEKNSRQTFLPSLNSVPGVRMEERSPGSYRLSVRGSLLRSPFGVRNIKIYLDELPLTDASGNTYLNLIDPSLIQRLEILKGPDGSLFGANSGGVILLNEHDNRDTSTLQGSISGGSYGLFRESIRISKSSERVQWNIGQAFQRSDGYRQQSSMKRLNLLSSGTLRYGSHNSIKLMALYSDMEYETPGGLTEEQYHADPQQSRPGTTEQHTGIFNKTFLGGITNELMLAPAWRYVLSVFGTLTDYRNPFITNYEVRDEKNAGIRSFVEYAIEKNALQFKWYAGVEGQRGVQDISNYENNGGEKGALQASDHIRTGQFFYFTRATLGVGDRLTTEMAVSLNRYQYTFKGEGNRKLANEWMPRAAVSYRIAREWVVRASVSRGYSPPTIAEIRPSGAVINNSLQAESGWNREAGIRFATWNNRLQFDASIFRYDLKNAIVRRTDQNDAEYFLNSGGTRQKGIECLLNFWLVPAGSTGAIRGMTLKTSYTYSDFTFDNYRDATADYSGNQMTGVPENNLMSGVTLFLPGEITLFVQSNFVSHIPLNDANTTYAERYELLQARAAWMIRGSNMTFEIFTGADNLLNQRYSLGNDINAFGGRYYNAAPLRNFYGGLSLTY